MREPLPCSEVRTIIVDYLRSGQTTTFNLQQVFQGRCRHERLSNVLHKLCREGKIRAVKKSVWRLVETEL